MRHSELTRAEFERVVAEALDSLPKLESIAKGAAEKHMLVFYNGNCTLAGGGP